jgi:hypothetical protein
MATVDQDLKAYLQADASILRVTGGRIHENYVPETPIKPYIWFVRTGDEGFDALDDPIGDPPDKFIFALECVGRNIKESSALATLVKNRCHKAVKPTFGSRTVGLVWCENQADGYEKVNVAEQSHTSDLQVEVFP